MADDTKDTRPDHHEHPHHHHPHDHEGFDARREAHDKARAHEEAQKVKEELAKVVQDKDLHVHKTHEWIHRLGHASSRILRENEISLDAGGGDTAWVNDALDAIFDAQKGIVAMAKATLDTADKHHAKGDEFDKAGIADKAKAVEAALDKIISLIPENQ